MKKVYACIDLKSFYASVECRERGLDPLKAHLVVADVTRTDKTICLAVSPSLKKYGIPGRPRLFEVKEKVGQINARVQNRGKKSRQNLLRRSKKTPTLQQKSLAPHQKFPASRQDNLPEQPIDLVIAPPRMKLYMKYSLDIYQVYLEFLSSEDILVYSIDEVFLDLTQYLKLYHLSARELVAKIIAKIYAKTGITATAGIGTNLYLAKVAMDILAKHMEPKNSIGVRMASLDEKSYREQLWAHRPLTDFWRVGRGYARKLQNHGIFTMGDVARVSLEDEDLLFQLFGVNAEYLIDHAWGYEPCTLAEAKNYQPEHHSLSEGQVLPGPYRASKARLVLQEMADEIALNLVKKHLISSQFVLTVGLSAPGHPWVRGTLNLSHRTSSTKAIMQGLTQLYDQIVDRDAKIRKINVTASEVVDENTPPVPTRVQLDLFGDFKRRLEAEAQAQSREKAERRVQQAVLDIKARYGKNAILRAMDFEDGATAKKRNREIGGHRG